MVRVHPKACEARPGVPEKPTWTRSLRSQGEAAPHGLEMGRRHHWDPAASDGVSVCPDLRGPAGRGRAGGGARQSGTSGRGATQTPYSASAQCGLAQAAQPLGPLHLQLQNGGADGLFPVGVGELGELERVLCQVAGAAGGLTEPWARPALLPLQGGTVLPHPRWLPTCN